MRIDKMIDGFQFALGGIEVDMLHIAEIKRVNGP